MTDMVNRNIFPAVSRFSGDMARTIGFKKAALPEDPDCAAEEELLLRRLSTLSADMMKETRALEAALAAPRGKDAYEAAHYYRYTVFEIMGRLREAVDGLEAVTDASVWPYPSYTELLFSVK